MTVDVSTSFIPETVRRPILLQYVRWLLLASRIVLGVDAEVAEFFVGGSPTKFVVVKRECFVEIVQGSFS